MSDGGRKDVCWASKQVAEAEERAKNSPELFLTREAARRLRDGGGGKTDRSGRDTGEQKEQEKIPER